LSPNIQLFIYFIAGITLAFAAVNLIIAFQKGSEKFYLFLGLMGVCVGIYYLIFPQIIGAEPGSVRIKTGLFFFITNFALLPWFICFYTGFCKKKIQWLLTTGMAISFVLLLFTNDYSRPVIWNVFAHIILLGIISFGFAAAIHQNKFEERRSAWLLIAALVILSLLTIDDIFRTHLIELYPFNIPDDILPLDYFLVFFMIIIGLKLAQDIQKKYQLEKSINLQEERWRNLLKKVELLVVGHNSDGTVNYVNPYFLKEITKKCLVHSKSLSIKIPIQISKIQF